MRLVANVVEKDIRRITPGLPADVEVDAFPGEKFTGRVAHVAPVLDPATRTAQIEVEIENSQFRLKPGMYAKVSFTVDKRAKRAGGPDGRARGRRRQPRRLPASEGEQGQVANFKPIDVGIVDATLAEVTSGLDEGDRVVTTGAAALREGDRILLPGRRRRAAAAAAGAAAAGGGRAGGAGQGGQAAGPEPAAGARRPRRSGGAGGGRGRHVRMSRRRHALSIWNSG